MPMFDTTHPLVLTAGLFGNLISVMVFLAPLPTFYGIYKKKSTERFHSIPYVAALFSCTLWMYYAYVKTDEFLLITINLFGCVIETIYISIFIVYAPKKAKIIAVLLLVLNTIMFGLVLLFTMLLTKGPNRVHVLGWICVAFSACVFAAPLTVMKRVIQTKSVEYLPFWLSFFLTLSAISWFSYGFLLKDIYIAIPNILGFTFGVSQMILYLIYKNNKKVIEPTTKMSAKIEEFNSVIDYREKYEEHTIEVQLERNAEHTIDIQQKNHGDELVKSPRHQAKHGDCEAYANPKGSNFDGLRESHT